jgi:hypothetical protein
MAYNSINRNQLHTAKKKFDFPNKLITLVKITMQNSQCHTKLQSELSELLNITNGLMLHNSLASLLFFVYCNIAL